jgi:hypothetical protein
MRTRLLPLRLHEAEEYLRGRLERSLRQVRNDADRARCFRLANLYTAISYRGDVLALNGVGTYRDFD